MPSPVTSGNPSKIDTVANASGFVLVVLALMVFAGWAFHDSVLTTVLTGLAAMKPNTAAAFLLAGLALLRRNHRDISVYSGGVFAIGIVTLGLSRRARQRR